MRVLPHIYATIRQLWCYEYSFFEECSSLTPGARWCPGGEYYEHELILLIPLWIPRSNEDLIEDYYDRYFEHEWLYKRVG